MKFALFCLGAFVVLGLGFGEPGWIFLSCAFVLWVAVRSHRVSTILLTVLAAVAILVAHFAGYKVYGGATVHDNRPLLRAPRQIASLAYPNVVLTTDGGRLPVRGVMFDQRLLDVPPGDLCIVFRGRSGAISVEADPASPSGVAFERHCEYWCGNTFFPTFFPRRLPAYSREDVGEYLVGCKLATSADWL